MTKWTPSQHVLLWAWMFVAVAETGAAEAGKDYPQARPGARRGHPPEHP